MYPIGVGAMHKEPFGSSEVIGRDSVAEQIIDGVHVAAERGRGYLSPLLKTSTPFGPGPEKVEPRRVVVRDRGIVERLRVVGISAALDQQQGQFLRLRVRWSVAFAMADHTGEDLERIAPAIVEP